MMADENGTDRLHREAGYLTIRRTGSGVSRKAAQPLKSVDLPKCQASGVDDRKAGFSTKHRVELQLKQGVPFMRIGGYEPLLPGGLGGRPRLLDRKPSSRPADREGGPGGRLFKEAQGVVSMYKKKKLRGKKEPKRLPGQYANSVRLARQKTRMECRVQQTSDLYDEQLFRSRLVVGSEWEPN